MVQTGLHFCIFFNPYCFTTNTDLTGVDGSGAGASPLPVGPDLPMKEIPTVLRTVLLPVLITGLKTDLIT